MLLSILFLILRHCSLRKRDIAFLWDFGLWFVTLSFPCAVSRTAWGPSTRGPSKLGMVWNSSTEGEPVLIERWRQTILPLDYEKEKKTVLHLKCYYHKQRSWNVSLNWPKYLKRVKHGQYSESEYSQSDLYVFDLTAQFRKAVKIAIALGYLYSTNLYCDALCCVVFDSQFEWRMKYKIKNEK